MWRETFYRTCSERTKGNAFKPKDGRLRLDKRKNFFASVTLGQAAQRSCGYPNIRIVIYDDDDLEFPYASSEI